MSSERKRRRSAPPDDDAPSLSRPEPSAADPLDDLSAYTCPICMEVCENATELSCAHSFCRSCLDAHLKGDGAPSAVAPDERICPVCRQTSETSPRPARDLAERRKLRAKCNDCGTVVALLYWLKCEFYRPHKVQG